MKHLPAIAVACVMCVALCACERPDDPEITFDGITDGQSISTSEELSVTCTAWRKSGAHTFLRFEALLNGNQLLAHTGPTGPGSMRISFTISGRKIGVGEHTLSAVLHYIEDIYGTRSEETQTKSISFVIYEAPGEVDEEFGEEEEEEDDNGGTTVNPNV